MASSTIDLRALSKHNRALAKTVGDLPVVMRFAGQRAGAAFDHDVRTALPPPVRRQPAAPYWTAKQRRWWWGTMHAKAQGRSQELPGWKAAYKKVNGRKALVISGAYKRTGTLVKSLAYEVRQTPTMTEIIYGTNRAYAKYVIDATDQATYHKGNWRTLQALARDSKAHVVQVFDETINAEIERRIGR